MSNNSRYDDYGQILPEDATIDTINMDLPQANSVAPGFEARPEANPLMPPPANLRRNSPFRRYRILLFGSTIAGLVVFIAGGVFWSLGLRNVPSAVLQVPVATPSAVPNAKPAITQAYDRARLSYADLRFKDAIPDLEKVVAEDATFHDDATVVLFSAYRAQAEESSKRLDTIRVAAENYSSAVRVADKYRPILLEQLKQQASLLPLGVKSGEELIQQTENNKIWFEAFVKGTGYNQAANGVTWWQGAIEAWSPIYKANKDFLSQLKEEALSYKLFYAYGEKATYSCSSGNLTEAKAALSEQLNIITLSRFGEDKLKEVSQRINEYEANKCIKR